MIQEKKTFLVQIKNPQSNDFYIFYLQKEWTNSAASYSSVITSKSRSYGINK